MKAIKRARAYVPAASVTKLRARTRVLVTLLAILVAAGIPGIANASTSASVSSHVGTWSITTPLKFTQSNAQFTTHTTVSGCVNTTFTQGTLGWHFRLIWFDGGQNKVLWTSREFSEVGRHCSPTITLNHNLPTVYSQETLDCGNPLGVIPCELNGTWLLKTD